MTKGCTAEQTITPPTLNYTGKNRISSRPEYKSKNDLNYRPNLKL